MFLDNDAPQNFPIVLIMTSILNVISLKDTLKITKKKKKKKMDKKDEKKNLQTLDKLKTIQK